MSENGKAKAAQNAWKHGMRGAVWIEKRRALAQLMRDARELLRLYS